MASPVWTVLTIPHPPSIWPYHAIPYRQCQTYHTIPYSPTYFTTLPRHTNKRQCNTKSRHIIPAPYHITSAIPHPPYGQGTTIPVPLYPPTSASLGRRLSFANESNAYLFWSGLHFLDACRIYFSFKSTLIFQRWDIKPSSTLNVIISKCLYHTFCAQPGNKDVSV